MAYFEKKMNSVAGFHIQDGHKVHVLRCCEKTVEIMLSFPSYPV